MTFSGLARSRRLHFNVHAALLPPGRHRLILRLRDADDKTLSVQVGAKLRVSGTQWAFLGLCDTARYPYADLAPDDPIRPWFDRPDAADYLRALRR